MSGQKMQHTNETASQSGFGAFNAIRHDADEALRLAQRASSLFENRAAETFDGLSDVARRLIPRDINSVASIARVIRLDIGHLQGLVNEDIDPASLPAESIATLGQLLGLSIEAFVLLVSRDHARAYSASPYGVQARSHEQLPVNQSEMEALRQAWERLSEDSAD